MNYVFIIDSSTDNYKGFINRINYENITDIFGYGNSCNHPYD